MANEEHLEILRQGVDAWNRWRADQRAASHFRVSADLIGADLVETDLSGVDLSDANLRNANLRDADLRDANLRDTYLGDARLVNVDLRGANLGMVCLESGELTRVDLRGADLRSARLSEARLNGVDLRDVNLRGAFLHDAFLRGVELRGADLRGAHLSFANLVNVDLRGTDLRGAELGRSVLCHVLLEGADVTGARAWGTVFSGVDLSGVEGLATVEHRGSSTVGIDTLQLSQGSIPGVFLRGCGVPDRLIEHNRSLRGQPAKHSCFITYANTQENFARQLHDALQDRGIRCWLYEQNIKERDSRIMAQAESFAVTVVDACGVTDKLVVCCCEGLLKSVWAEPLIQAALKPEGRADEQMMIAVDLDGYLFQGWQNDLAPEVRNRLAADFTGWEKDDARFEEQVERVVESLETGQ